MLCSINGEFTDRLPVTDRGLAYGDGVFETMRMSGGLLPLWDYHQRRLQLGCDRLAIPLQNSELEHWLRDFLGRASRLGAEGVVKLIVTRGQSQRGYGFDANTPPTVVLQRLNSVVLSSAPQSLDFCVHRLPQNPLLAGIKHLNRLDNVMLKHECQIRGVDDGVVLDSAENVIETTHSNLFFLSGNQLLTPDLAGCGVAGVMREFILQEIAPALFEEVAVTTIPATELGGYDAAFSCNSIRGIRAIDRIGSMVFNDSPLLQALLQKLTQSRFGRGV